MPRSKFNSSEILFLPVVNYSLTIQSFLKKVIVAYILKMSLCHCHTSLSNYIGCHTTCSPPLTFIKARGYTTNCGLHTWEKKDSKLKASRKDMRSWNQFETIILPKSRIKRSRVKHSVSSLFGMLIISGLKRHCKLDFPMAEASHLD